MPRPKKKKVTVVQALSETLSRTGVEEQLVRSPVKTMEKLPAPEPPRSPGKPMRLEAGRELKAAGKVLKWAIRQQSAAEERYRCELRVHAAKCAQLERKKITGTAAERMSAAYDLLDGVSKADKRYLLAVVDAHEAQLDAAAARIGEQSSKIRLLELQIARFRRLQRVRRKRQ